MHELMTTKEVADYLRIKERRVYELLRQGEIPCTRVTGKWLFPKALIDIWLAQHAEATPRAAAAPPVMAGSHDPLLDWALKESGAGLAVLAGGSLDGLTRLAAGEAMAAAIHLLEPETGAYNVPAVEASLGAEGVVLIEWAKRRQGLLLAPGNPAGVEGLGDLKAKGLRLVCRQAEAGSQILLLHLLEAAGLTLEEIALSEERALSESDLGLAILEGRADAGVGVESVARSLKLDFLPLTEERLDLAMRRRAYFEAPMQKLLAFANGPAFAEKAASLGGYDVSELGRVRYNGP